MGERAQYEAARRQAPRAPGAQRLRSLALLGALCCALAPACGDDPGGTAPAATCPRDLPSDADCPDVAPAYETVIAPILERRCQGCHYPQNPFSRVVLDDYERVFAARRTALTLVYGCRMPPAEGTPLSAEERRALLAWLVCGAPRS